FPEIIPALLPTICSFRDTHLKRKFVEHPTDGIKVMDIYFTKEQKLKKKDTHLKRKLVEHPTDGIKVMDIYFTKEEKLKKKESYSKIKHVGQPTGGHNECEILGEGPEAAESESLWSEWTIFRG
ncbi:hypothetical protein RRG08_041508, partial [Elysia crispata]